MNMKQFAAALMTTFACTNIVCAQSFIGDLKAKKNGQGTVTVTQSSEIDELVDKAHLVKTTPAAPPQPHRDNSAATRQTTGHAEHTAPRPSTEAEQPMANANTGKKVMRNSYKVDGYRVQVFAGGNTRNDKQQAERTGNDIKALFPTEPVYVHFYSPRWICRMGNCRTYEEAHSMLVEVKNAGYKQAAIVKGKISVQY